MPASRRSGDRYSSQAGAQVRSRWGGLQVVAGAHLAPSVRAAADRVGRGQAELAVGRVRPEHEGVNWGRMPGAVGWQW